MIMFNPGDIVQLVSGSPPLTVTRVRSGENYPQVLVAWWDYGDLRLEQREFPSVCLKLHVSFSEPAS